MATKPETFVEYLRRVGSDYQASASATNPEEVSPTAEDYQRAADTIEDFARALAKVAESLGLDDLSNFEPEQRRAIRLAMRFSSYKVMGKRIL